MAPLAATCGVPPWHAEGANAIGISYGWYRRATAGLELGNCTARDPARTNRPWAHRMKNGTDDTAASGRPRITGASSSDQISVELSARRTGMSFQRTRMSADRTLMSVIRTALSLIGFGFTIFQVFEKANQTQLLPEGAGGRRLGLVLLVLGCLVLIGGIGYHISFMRGLRRQREQMKQEGLIHAESVFPVSLILIAAILLLISGLTATVSVMWNIGPLQ
jgi:putative membrane protein